MRKVLMAGVASLATLALSNGAWAQASPAPGTITVRLNGRVAVYAGAAFESDFNTPTINPITGAPQTGGKLQQDVGIASYMRIYPAFDGVAANGLKYGAKIELRQDNGAGNGVNASPSSQSYSRGAVYVRRAYGYIGTDQLGQLQFGQTDGPASLFLEGTMENFNDGGWDGDAPGMIVGNGELSWPWADGEGNEYTSEKIVYLSPQFYGFDVGFSYAPTTNGSSVSPGCNVGGPGCMMLSSTNDLDSLARARNTLEAGIRYRGSFGAFGIAANANYIGSGKVNDSSGPPAITGNPVYRGLNVWDFGLQTTFGGFTVGGNITGGEFTPGFGLLQKGQARTLAWVAGASYGQGPWIVGVQYLNVKSAGSPALAGFSELSEWGVAAGGTYTLAPGLALYLDYLYGHRKQSGWDFVDGGGQVGFDHNAVQAQYIGTGAMLTW